MKPPYKNLIIISVDCLRSDCINANPDKRLLKKYNLSVKPKTPILDWFIKNGIFFNNCITAAPYTTAAHAAILTGLWPYNNGIIDFFGTRLKSQTIFSILKEKGYQTLFQTDYPFILGSNLGFDKGVDKFIYGNEEDSINWITANKNKRMACFFHFANVHAPYGFFNLKHGGDYYRNKVKKLLKKYRLKPDKNVYDGQHFITGDFTEEEKILKQNYFKIINKMHELGEYDKLMDMYIEGINFFEKRRFKKFINALKKTKLMDNSIVVVVGDHGEDWNENNQGHNRGNLADGLTEGNIKVPLIFYGTNLPRKINLNRVRTIDIVPTTLSLLGIHCDVKFDGLDLFDHKNIGKDLDAYSQIWETNSANVTILMNKVKKTGTMETPNFSSKLASSVLFKNDVKIEKNYKKEKIYCKNKNFLINNKTKDEMRKSLNSYNNKTKDSLLKQEKIAKKVGKTELAEQLRCLGYNV